MCRVTHSAPTRSAGFGQAETLVRRLNAFSPSGDPRSRSADVGRWRM